MNTTLNNELKNEIIRICHQNGAVDNLFMFEHIPPNKLKNAISSYAPLIRDDEAIVFLFDDTLFGSANDGFILTTKHLFSKNFAETRGGVAISDIENITIKHGLSATINVQAGINKLGITVTQVVGRSERNALFEKLNSTVKLLKNTKIAGVGSSNNNVNQVETPHNCRNCGAPLSEYSTRCEYCNSRN